jgi:hypothetical protein
MITLSNTESALVADLLEAIARAMDQLPEVDPEFANKTKLQKLVFLAVDEFDLPVTYSWYLAGSVVPDDSVAPATLDSTIDDLPSPAEPSIDSSTPDELHPDDDSPDVADQSSTSTPDPPVDPVLFDDFGDDTDTATEDPSIDAYVKDRADLIDFYSGVIPTVWHQDTMRFLQNFYHDHAPPRFRSLYLSSIHLRTHLADIESAVKTIVGGEEPRTPLSDLIRSTELVISDLHLELREDEDLRQTFEPVVKGTDIIEDALLMLDQLPADELGPEHVEAVARLQDFFYYEVWRYPCLIISRETATGPQAETLRAEQANRLATLDENYAARCEELQEYLADVGLVPDVEDYPTPDDDLHKRISDLANEYLEP